MKQHILVVEDDETLQSLLVFCLEKEGHSVARAGSAKEMHEQLRSGGYDLILLDLGLPDEDGLILVRQLRAQLDTPIVVVTGNQDQGALLAALELGANDYLKKPFDPRELTLRVNRVLTQIQLEKQLREQATTDGLTGLSNRRAFDERLEQEWRRAERVSGPMALIMLDVDFFKRYNDRFGHGAGDECLRQVAGVLIARRRASDFAARVGGEEFCLILPNTEWEGALVVAEAVRSGIEVLRISHPESPYSIVTVSIGVVACEPQLTESVRGLMDAADQALYEGKRDGRNRVVKASRVLKNPLV